MAYTHNYKRRSNVSPGLIFIILLVGTAWAHREQLSTIAHWIIIGLPVVGCIAALAILIRILKAYQQYRRRHVLDIAGVDAIGDGVDLVPRLIPPSLTVFHLVI